MSAARGGAGEIPEQMVVFNVEDRGGGVRDMESGYEIVQVQLAIEHSRSLSISLSISLSVCLSVSISLSISLS